MLVSVLLTSLPPNVSGDVSDFNDGFASYLKQVLEHLRANMEHGLPELKIPPLDPLTLNDRLSIDVKDFGNVKINDLKVYGLKTVDIKGVKADLTKPSASIKLNVRNIKAKGTYIANLLFAKLFPVKGNGDLLIDLTDVQLTGEVLLDTEDFMRFECKDVEFSLNVGQAKINFENIIDPKLAPTINKILSGFTPLIVNVLLPTIQHELTPALVHAINKELTKLDIADLIQKITN